MRVLVAVFLILGLSSLVCSSPNPPSPSSPSMFPTGHGIVKTRLMVMFLSHAEDDRRDSLRQTWLKDEANETQWVFMLGNIDYSSNKQQILKEQESYGDIIIMNDVADDYRHLSDKVLRGFEEVYQRYEFDYLLKTDTDTFVVLPKLLEHLQGVSPVKRYIGSLAFTQDKGELWFGQMKGVNYMLGGGYILSNDLIGYFAHSQHLLLRSPSEDVTVGIHLQSTSAQYELLDETVFRAGAAAACKCDPSVILNHKCKRNDMYYMHYSYEATGNACEYQKDPAFAQNIAKAHNLSENEEMVIRW